jgi:DNA-binding Lrp family transcriptional regulator
VEDAKPEIPNEPYHVLAFGDSRPARLEITAFSAYESAEEGRVDTKYPNCGSESMPMRACVHLITNPGTAKDVAMAISKIDGVISTDLTTGRFDIMVLVDKEDADLAWLQNTVLAKIRREQGVVRTETAICTEKFART